MPQTPSTNAKNAALINQLAHGFYRVVPEQYRTYCAFTTEIIQKVLHRLSVPCERVPCQILYTQPDHIYVIGFLGKHDPAKWDGHIVCCAGGILIDAALHHFEQEFGLQVPWMITTPMLNFPTSALAHVSMNSSDAIWWQSPPAGVATQPPSEPQDLVQQYADALIIALTPSLHPLQNQ
jgi:hypothetical protein